MKKRTIILTSGLALLTVIVLVFAPQFFNSHRRTVGFVPNLHSVTEDLVREDSKTMLTEDSYEKIRAYCQSRNMNDKVFILIDYKIPSNRNRLFVIDAENKKVLYKSLCAHGLGGGSTPEVPVFSNEPGSNCSSLGAFEISEYYKMPRFRNEYSFRLKGHDHTNYHAYYRGIMIHGSGTVDRAQAKHNPKLLPMNKTSEGCQVVTHQMVRNIKTVYDRQDNKRVLVLAIYDLPS